MYGITVYLHLGTNFKRNTTSSSLGVINSLGTSFDVSRDLVVVTSGEGTEVVETVDGDSVFRSVVANGSGVAGDVALGNIVCSLSPE